MKKTIDNLVKICYL